MTGRLVDKVAVVTGSNSGIGRGIALAYGREGAKVICANRSEASKNSKDIGNTHDVIVKSGGHAEFMNVTVTDTQSVSQLVQRVVQKYGRIDILVNVAGNAYDMTSGKEFWDLSDESIEQTIDVNLTGSLKMMRAVSGVMIKQEPNKIGDRGRIINIGSVFGPRGFGGAVVYCSTKSGIQGATTALAVAGAPYNVKVHSINPGTVVTSMTEGLPEPAEAFLKSKALLGFGQPEDVASAAVFLASDESKWMTGTELYVDGGYMLT